MTHIHARPNLNGNDALTFSLAAQRLHDATVNVDIVLRQIKQDCLHGRNYQTVATEGAADADLAVLQDARDAIHRLIALSVALHQNSRT
jgi:hypothetical protein